MLRRTRSALSCEGHFLQLLRSSTRYESFAVFISRLRKSFAVSYGAPILDNSCFFEFANYSWAPCARVRNSVSQSVCNCFQGYSCLIITKDNRTVLLSMIITNHSKNNRKNINSVVRILCEFYLFTISFDEFFDQSNRRISQASHEFYFGWLEFLSALILLTK